MTYGQWVGLLVAALALYAITTCSKSRAHESWISKESLRDPITKDWCCGADDCFEQKANVTPIGSDYYYINSTGEIISRKRVIWRSPGSWWRCVYLSGAKMGQTRCLIGPWQGY